jgi:serine/threonine-protein kinase ULK/ATG1
MLWGECPFEERSISALINAVETREVRYPARSNVTNRSIDLLKLILVKDPEKRISWEDLFKKELTD